MPAQNEETKRVILADIRRHLAASAPHDAVRASHHARHAGAPSGEDLSRGGDAPAHAAATPAPPAFEGTAVERFRQALEAVAGHCLVVRNEAEAAEALRQIVGRRGAGRVAASDSPLVGRVLKLAALPAEVLEDAPASDLFDCDLGVTGAQWGVAETGTLVLESDAERHRLASLVPAAHVALLEAGRVRQTLGEVLRDIGERGERGERGEGGAGDAGDAGGGGGLSRAVTLITGPSRTSDIELTLAIGVHGPAELYVVIIGGEENG